MGWLGQGANDGLQGTEFLACSFNFYTRNQAGGPAATHAEIQSRGQLWGVNGFAGCSFATPSNVPADGYLNIDNAGPLTVSRCKFLENAFDSTHATAQVGFTNITQLMFPDVTHL